MKRLNEAEARQIIEVRQAVIGNSRGLLKCSRLMLAQFHTEYFQAFNSKSMVSISNSRPKLHYFGTAENSTLTD
jgi:hypothetical protein